MKTLHHHLLTLIMIFAGSVTFYTCQEEELVTKFLVETNVPGNITTSSVRISGKIKDAGKGAVEHGHCWSEYGTPTIYDNRTKRGPVSGKGVFSSHITGLKPETVYHVRAYIQTTTEVVYGKLVTFTTLDGSATIKTARVTQITFNSAVSGGSITDLNGAEVIMRGVCWDTLASVSLEANAGFTTNGSGIGSFSSDITGLLEDRTYYVKAFAVTSLDTAYGEAISIVTLAGKGTLTTVAPSDITATTATTGGKLVHDGGSPVYERGVCYGTIENPDITGTKTSDGSGLGIFVSSLIDLIPNTIYYIRAYATNEITTIYGEQYSFLTKGLPEIITSVAGEFTDSSAKSGGNVTADWGYPVTAKGVCWSTARNPTTADNMTTDGSGLGSFTSDLHNLIPGILYYARAYATNSIGTNYGEQNTFILTEIVEIISPVTGRTWMDRNLGASRSATNLTDSQAFGDLYQWGRGNDGHEKINSITTPVLSSTDVPGHGYFITGKSDWRSPSNYNLWQGVNGINNPCPAGFRLPTEAEWQIERNSWSPANQQGAFSSIKLVKAPLRFENGSIYTSSSAISSGYYWSSTINGNSVRGLFFRPNEAGIFSGGSRARGYSVRCIKD